MKKQKCNKKNTLRETEKNEIVKQAQLYDSIKDIADKTKHSTKTVKKILIENKINVNKNKKKTFDADKKIPHIIDSLKRTRSFSGTAKEFGVSDNAIRKLLNRRGYPKHIKELLQFIK